MFLQSLRAIRAESKKIIQKHSPPPEVALPDLYEKEERGGAQEFGFRFHLL